MRSKRSYWVFGLLAATIGLLATGCGGEGRSVSAFCEAVDKLHEDMEAKYVPRADALGEMGESDPLAGLLAATGNAIEGMGDVEVGLSRISRHAPDEIRDEAEAVHGSFQAQFDTMKEMGSNPLGGLFAGLVTGLGSMGPTTTLNEYSQSNCGRIIL